VIAYNSPTCTDSTGASGYYYPNAITGDCCTCPRCGCIHPQGQHAPQDEIILRASPRPKDRPFLTPEQVWRLRNLSYRLSRDAIVEARVVQKRARDDLRTHVTLQARQRPYVRALFKKRVCGGSSRYRVMVN
jgi:hypothetical protein